MIRPAAIRSNTGNFRRRAALSSTLAIISSRLLALIVSSRAGFLRRQLDTSAPPGNPSHSSTTGFSLLVFTGQRLSCEEQK